MGLFGIHEDMEQFSATFQQLNSTISGVSAPEIM
jgi:hypothetical protein